MTSALHLWARQLRFWSALAGISAPVWAPLLLSGLLGTIEQAQRAAIVIVVTLASAWNSFRIVGNLARDRADQDGRKASSG